ncbi:ROK family protein [Microbacterium tumbae]
MIGLDIGGTKIAAVLLDDTGTVRERSWHEHSARGVERLADELSATALALLERADGASVPAVGVSVSGLVARDGNVTGGASLEIFGDLAGAVAQRLSLPAQIINDGEATLRAVVAAYREDTGANVDDAVLLTLGTGVGGAIISAGRAIRGITGLATELGHLPVRQPSDRRCVCGSSGCLEQFAGGKGIAERAMLASPAGTARKITARDVIEAAHAGDASALALLDDAATAVADAIRALCVTIEPRVVFLSGTIAHASADLLIDRIREHIARHWSFAGLTEPPPVQLDAVGPFAAAIGAALSAQDHLNPSDNVTASEGNTHD